MGIYILLIFIQVPAGGGAIYNGLIRSRMELVGCDLTYNTATTGNGGAISTVDDIIVTNSRLQGNTAIQGVWKGGGRSRFKFRCYYR